MSRCNHGTQGLWDILCFRRTSHGRRITWVYSPTHSLARAHVGASASRASSGPCVQVRLSARFAEPAHALERQPAQAVLRVDLGARERAENVAAAHRRREQPSVSQQLAPPKHRSQWMHRDPRDPRVGPRWAGLFGIVTFTASHTVDVRFQCLGVPKACVSCSVRTGCGYCNIVLALQRRSRHVQGKVFDQN